MIDPNSQLVEELSRLTAVSNRSLVETVAKLFEEGGELSEAVLSATKTKANEYKHLGKDDVLEESVDVIICAASIYLKANGSLDGMNDYIENKLAKWNRNLTKK